MKLGEVYTFKEADKQAYTDNPPIGTELIYVGDGRMLGAGGLTWYLDGAKAKPGKKASKELLAKVEASHRTHIQSAMTRGRKWIQTGSDPEIFAVDENGRIIPAFTFLPDKSTVKGRHERPYWDGFQAEWTIAPDTCHSYSVDTVQRGLKGVYASAQSVNPNAKLTWEPLLEIPDDLRKATHPKHLELGCAPSKNGYLKGAPQLDGLVGAELKIRFAGFHIHHGVEGLTRIRAKHMVKQLDRVLAVMFVAILDGMDNPIRRKFYGAAGEYRLPSHGLEYRVLSSAVEAHPALVHLAFDMARLTSMYSVSGITLINADNDRVRSIINECDAVGARKLVGENKDFYKSAFTSLYYDDIHTKKAFRLIEKGAKELMSLDMTSNWQLGKGGYWTTHSDGREEDFRKTTIK